MKEVYESLIKLCNINRFKEDEMIIDRLSKLLCEDKKAYTSCESMSDFHHYLDIWVDGMWRVEAETIIGHPLQKIIKLSFPNVSLFNKGCSVEEENGYVIVKCRQGDTIEIKSNRDLQVVIKMNAVFRPLTTCLKPGKKYQIKLSRWLHKLSIVEDLYDLS